MQIAELNIARLAYDIMDPRVADFVNNLNRVNAAAERSDGFVWRLKDEASGTQQALTVGGDPRIIPNLSVWRDVGSLERFVFQTVHKRIYERRSEWFEVMEKMHFVMWQVEDGHKPTLDEALDRLEHLDTHGSTDNAFGWEHVSDATLWRTARCASSAA